MTTSEAEQQALAAQLAAPHGEQAATVAERMNAINAAMVADAIARLAPAGGETIVEIGPGNGVLSLPLLAALAPHGRYVAIEHSAAMAAELERLAAAVDEVAVEVQQCDALAAALAPGSVDGVLAVNVLYFVADLESLFQELQRWLRPGGRVVFGVRSVASLRSMPFTAYGFRLREPAEIAAALQRAGFEAVEIHACAGPLPTAGGPPLDYSIIAGWRG